MSWTEILQGIGILIAAASTAYLALGRWLQEKREKEQALSEKQSNLDKADRNGVIQGEREYSDRLEKRIEELNKEVKQLREQVTELYDLIHKMQKSSVVKDEAAAEQTAQISKLQEGLLKSKDETKVASVAVARMEGEKAGAASTTAPTIAEDVHDAVRAVKDVLSENVTTVKRDVKEVKKDVKEVKGILDSDTQGEQP